MNAKSKDLIKYIFDTDLEYLDRNLLSENKGLSALCLFYKSTLDQHKLTEKFGDSINFGNITTSSVPEFMKEISKYANVDISANVSMQKPYVSSHGERFDQNYFIDLCVFAGMRYSKFLVTRFICSLVTKPLVILTGLSGSGKTKLAQAFSFSISDSNDQYAIVPVGADWTNREPLLGYPNSLLANHYVKPDSGVLDILLQAHADFQANNEELAKCKPYFLILDEMNLSHVERYFADFLSTMESGEAIKLYSGSDRYAELDNDQTPITSSLIPRSVKWPRNLFIIGTVNIDETTYMFSPKVLDRANTIEFRIAEDEMKNYFEGQITLNLDLLLESVDTKRGRGASLAPAFMRLASREGVVINRNVHQDSFVKFFTELQKAGAEFGYRTANEMTELMAFLAHFNVETNEAYDIAIMQKLLPKLHGSRSKLNKVIPPLLALCENDGKVIYPLSHEKLNRMKKNADENGFASYAEA
jgi:5-methylcytosine-specific restriction protein B